MAKWVLPDTNEMSKVHNLMQEHNISATKLAEIIKDYLDEYNQNPKPFHWTASADLILNKVASVCKRISNSRH